MEREAEVVLAAFVAARDGGEVETMLSEWKELAIVMFDYLQRQVDLFALRGRLDAHERQDVKQDAFARMLMSVHGRRPFAGSSVGELRGFTKTVALRAAQELRRQAGRRTEHNDSFERPVAGGEDAPTVGDLADARRAQRERSLEERVLDGLELDERRAFVEWALPQVKPAPRTVFELLRAGKTVPEVMDELDMKENTVHVNSKRALDQLRELWERYPR